jgi:hypothetical protein
MMYLVTAAGWCCLMVQTGYILWLLSLVARDGMVILIEPSPRVLVTEIGLAVFILVTSCFIICKCIWRLIKERREKKHDTGQTTTT